MSATWCRLAVVLGWACLLVLLVATALPAVADWQLAQEGMVGYSGIATDGSLYVAVGDYGEIVTSPDAVTWTERVNSEPGCFLFGVTYGGGRFVAVGDCSLVLTSPDGVTWTQQDTSAVTWPARLRAVAFGSSDGSPLYVAVGRAGKVIVSVDAVAWEDADGTFPSSDLSALAYSMALDLWVVVGAEGTLFTSSGTPTLPPGTPQDLRGVTYAGTQFVAVGNSPVAAITSPDGVVWTVQTVPAGGALRGVTVGNGLIVAVGYNATILTSPNGVTWTPRSEVDPGPGVSISMVAVTFGTTGFVAGGLRGNVYTSPDGTSDWVSQTLPESRYLEEVAHDGVRYCAVGANGAVASSPDGATWTNETALDHQVYWYWHAVTHALGQFWAVGVSDTIMSSPDCSTWTAAFPATPPPPRSQTSNLFDVVYGEGMLVVVGEGYPPDDDMVAEVLTSSDGSTWTPGDLGLDPVSQGFDSAVAVGYGAGRFVVSMTEYASGTPHLLTSEDGCTWGEQTSPLSSGDVWADIAYFDGSFVAVGNGIWTSQDGISWTRRLATDEVLASVAHRDGSYVAAGGWGAVYASPDGVHWVPEAGATGRDLAGVAVAVGGARFVAVGQSVVERTDSIAAIFIDDFESGDTSAWSSATPL